MMEIFLYIFVITGAGDDVYRNRISMPSFVECQETIKHSKTDIAKGGDAESGIAMFCGGKKFQILYGYRDPPEWQPVEMPQ